MTAWARIRELGSVLRSALIFWPLTVVCTLLLEPISLAASLFKKGGRVQHGVVRLWSGLLLKLYGMPVAVSGLEGINPTKPQIYAANHLSALDIPLLYRYLPFQFRIIAHRLVFRIPLIGWQLRASGQLEIDPGSLALARRALREAVRTLRNGMPLVVFPEGERSPTGEMLPFRLGTFYVAVEARADVVPVAILGTYEALRIGCAHLRPRPLQLIVGDAIPISGYTRKDVNALARRTQEAVAEMLREVKNTERLAIGF